jgi:predicted RNA binding protein YcfA (HicA-like mRNA interferase family)
MLDVVYNIVYNTFCRKDWPMKRRDLIKMLEAKGWYLKEHGAGHDKYTNGKETEMLPRHSEIKESLAKAIIRRRCL